MPGLAMKKLQFFDWIVWKNELEKSSNQMTTKIDLRIALAPLTQSMGAINRTFFFVTNQSRLKVPCCATNLWVAKVNHFLPWFFSLKATHINFDTLINKAELLLLKPRPFICPRRFISKKVGNRRN